MDSFPKINGLIQELYTELDTLKKELENDVHYTASQAEIVTFVELAEEMLHEFRVQIRNIEGDIDALAENINEQCFDYDDDNGSIETQSYSPFADDDEN